AVADARRAADATVEAMALTALAQAQRLRGEPCWRETLGRALAVPADPVPGRLHLGPQYMAARFAMVDDRLDEARSGLLRLLAVAEQDRTGEALVEVLRSLSEVATRAGRCRDALRYAHRAVDAAQRAGLSPGPTWYTAAVAELAGGSLAAAAGYARRGVRASEQEGDSIYLRRNLHALGQAELRAGETRAGVAALRRLRDLEAEFGVGDPLIVRWRGDLAGGLAALGEHDEAAATLAAARAAAHRLGSTPGMIGYLDRASAVVLSERGQADTAVILSAAAALHFEQLHQPIEQAHALLVQGGAERRRRRYAAARVAIGAALAIFLTAEARPWTEQTERALARTESTSADVGLTSTEARAAAHRLGTTPGVTGYLDRATAVVLSESGQADSAVMLSAAAALHFEQLHQPIEQAHALLVQGGAERRRRRYAAARVAIGAALAIFLAADAKPWAEQTERALARTEGSSAPLDLGLTSTELRIAALVRDGASNREIASRLYLSVKTVEATLTRVYRKLGVRSRTQLSSRLQTPSVSEVTSGA
ncbi:MAG TPA: helix-turn-helix transcriptional regulator, partial [Actinomycetota bacterium]